MTSVRLLCALWLCALCGGATCAAPPEPVVQPALQAARPVIGPSDLVEVRIFGEPELSGSFRVDGQGAM
ncbi:MAG: polysaccharide biosynthesis/export family protein, partial [Myxococcota bacterium]